MSVITISELRNPKERSQIFREKMNPMLRGWANFYRHAWGAKKVFNALDHYVWWTIARWLKKKHRLSLQRLAARSDPFPTRAGPRASKAKETTKEMTISARSRTVLKSVNWFWPAYMRRGYMEDLITKLEVEPEGPQRLAVFETSLALMYESKHLAAMLLERYRCVPMVQLFQAHPAFGWAKSASG